jgi:DNA-directed RNA polymerase subunit N (RpoN/RPB10)
MERSSGWVSTRQHIPTSNSQMESDWLMPIRCYSCGKVFYQLAIEKMLKAGLPLDQVMDKLNYIRICCRMRILASPCIISLQKQLEQEENIKNELNNLSIYNTGQFPREHAVSTGSVCVLSESTPLHNEAYLSSTPTGAIPEHHQNDAFDLNMEQE